MRVTNRETIKVKMILLVVCLFIVCAIPQVKATDYEKGLEAAQNGDYATALKEWQSLAEQGDVGAQFNLGLMYYSGEGAPQDYKQAFKWFTKAAEQGNARAQFKYGEMYYKGNGVPRDYKETVKWFTKAAEQGDVSAQFVLGVMYQNGEGVLSNNKLAYVWSSLAAASGYGEAVKNSEICAEKLSPKELAEAQKLLAKIKNKKGNRKKTSSQRIIIPANEN